MARSQIKGITIEIDGNTTKLEKALAGTDDQLKKTQTSLKDVNKLLKMDPGNAELLAQKQRLLAEAVSGTSQRLETLSKAAQGADEALARGQAYTAKYGQLEAELAKVDAAYKELTARKKEMDTALSIGEISAGEYEKYTAEVKKAGAQLKDLRAQVLTAKKEMGGPMMDQDQFDALQREFIESGEAAKNAQRDFQAFNSTLGQLSAKTAAVSQTAGKISSAFAPVSTAIAGIGAAALATVPATEEFRADMSMLEQNAKNAGVGMSPLERAFKTVMLTTEDTSGSIKTLESLMNAGVTENNIQQSVESLAGALDRFPDSFKFESLAKDLQETVESGAAVGDFARLLDQLGVDVEDFNSRLSKAPESADKLNFALGILAQNGLADEHEGWIRANRDLVDSRAARLALVDTNEVLNSAFTKTAENAGLWMDPVTRAFETFLAVSGETDSAIEAVSNLLQAGVTESNLQRAVENLAGAAEMFPDTLKIESLADSLQETVRTGEATGQFAELIERLGIDLDVVNGSLAATSDESLRLNNMLDVLSSAGLADNHQAWVQQNQDLVDSRESQQRLMESMADLAKTVQPLITEVTDVIAGLLDAFNGLPEGAQAGIAGLLLFVGGISPVAGAVSNTSKVLGDLSSFFAKIGGPAGKASAAVGGMTAAAGGLSGSLGGVLSAAGSLFTGPVGIVVLAGLAAAALTGLWDSNEEFRAAMESFDQWITGVFSTDWTESFGVAGEVLNAFFANASNIYESIKQFLGGIIDFIGGTFTGDWERAWQGVSDIFAGIWNLLVSLVKSPINGIIGLINTLLAGVTTGINGVIGLLNNFQVDVPEWVPGLGGESFGFNLAPLTAPSIPYLASGGLARRNNPFLAVVGDNPTQDEVISPYSTIVDAVREALSGLGATGGAQNITLTINGDLAALFRLFRIGIQTEDARLGPSLAKT